MGLRPSELGPFYDPSNEKPIILAENVSIANVKEDIYFKLQEMHLAPTTFNPNVLIALHTSKADSQGKRPLVSVAKNPAPCKNHECALSSILLVLKQFPPLLSKGAGIYSGVPSPHLVQGQVRQVLRLVAKEHGIDDSRLTLHSFRHLKLSQFLANDIDPGTIKLETGWQSDTGMKEYFRTFAKKTTRFATALHDTSAISPYQLKIISSNIATPT